MIYVYSKANCPGCVQLKSQLTAAGIEFVEVRVDQDQQAMTHLKYNGHRSVPQMYRGYCEGAYLGSKFTDLK
jgi:glutaredoxin